MERRVEPSIKDLLGMFVPTECYNDKTGILFLISRQRKWNRDTTGEKNITNFTSMWERWKDQSSGVKTKRQY